MNDVFPLVVGAAWFCFLGAILATGAARRRALVSYFASREGYSVSGDPGRELVVHRVVDGVMQQSTARKFGWQVKVAPLGVSLHMRLSINADSRFNEPLLVKRLPLALPAHPDVRICSDQPPLASAAMAVPGVRAAAERLVSMKGIVVLVEPDGRMTVTENAFTRKPARLEVLMEEIHALAVALRSYGAHAPSHIDPAQGSPGGTPVAIPASRA